VFAKAGLSQEEIAEEVIWQMALYGGFPSGINALMLRWKFLKQRIEEI